MNREQAKTRLRSAAGSLQQPGSMRNVLGAAFVAGFFLGFSRRVRRATGSTFAALIKRLSR